MSIVNIRSAFRRTKRRRFAGRKAGMSPDEKPACRRTKSQRFAGRKASVSPDEKPAFRASVAFLQRNNPERITYHDICRADIVIAVCLILLYPYKAVISTGFDKEPVVFAALIRQPYISLKAKIRRSYFACDHRCSELRAVFQNLS